MLHEHVGVPLPGHERHKAEQIDVRNGDAEEVHTVPYTAVSENVVEDTLAKAARKLYLGKSWKLLLVLVKFFLQGSF